MLDKNGVEIKTGQVVEITRAYRKSDNGLYFVTNSPGDPGCLWCTIGYTLMRISKNGKISKATNNIRSWPITSRFGEKWDAEPEQIEVKSIANMNEISAYFQAVADEIEESNWIEESNYSAVAAEEIQNFYRAIAANCKNVD